MEIKTHNLTNVSFEVFNRLKKIFGDVLVKAQCDRTNKDYPYPRNDAIGLNTDCSLLLTFSNGKEVTFTGGRWALIEGDAE